MRIALDATYSVDPRPSGIAIYSRELLQGLAEQYAEQRFIHCYRPKQFRKAPAAQASNVSKRPLLPPLPTFWADVFHALNQRVDRRPAKKVVSTFHDLFVMTGNYSSFNFRKRFTQQAIEAAKQSDLIIAVSEFTAGQVHDLLQVERSRIRIIPHGVRVPPTFAPEGREQLILFVGALQERKNISRLVAAIDALPTGWKLVLAGSPTGFRADAILRDIDASRSRDRIEVAGYVTDDELERLYGRASVFAFPSLDEGFGMPVLDAMARGIPVVTSNGSALSEVAGAAALLVNPEDTQEIAAALDRLIRDECLRTELIARGRERAAQFSWRRAVEATWKAYTALYRS